MALERRVNERCRRGPAGRMNAAGLYRRWRRLTMQSAPRPTSIKAQVVGSGASEVFRIPYDLPAALLGAYTEYKGTLGIVDAAGRSVSRSE